MDLQKERKAFDAYFKEKYPELYKDVFDEDGDDRAIIGYSFAWQSWQAAKAQAVPEGFVVVPKTIPENVVERLKNSSYHWGENTKDYFSPIYKMMVEEAARGGNE